MVHLINSFYIDFRKVNYNLRREVPKGRLYTPEGFRNMKFKTVNRRLYSIYILMHLFFACNADEKNSDSFFVSNPVKQSKPEQEIKPLKIGLPAPDFRLPGVDEKWHTFDEFKDAKALVVVFLANHCPTSQGFEDQIIQVYEEYGPKGVAFIAISGTSPFGIRDDELGYTDVADSFDDMVIRAKDKGFKFAYLYDGDDQKVTMAYGPTATPHVFVFDENKIHKYNGRIGKKEGKQGQSENLRNALEAVLNGTEIEMPVTKAFGCNTKWSWLYEKNKNMKRQWMDTPIELEEVNVAQVQELLKNDQSEKLRLINVWATWCGPCVTEYPEFMAINRSFFQRDFEFISLCADKIQNKDKALKFLQKQKSHIKNYIFSGDDVYELVEAVDPEWNAALPYTILIEPGGKVVYQYQGLIDPRELRRIIVDHPLLGRVWKG